VGDLVKIQPWPFGDQVVTLHWIGNVRLKDKQWYIQVAFVDKSNCELIELPIGILSMLRIGIPYKEGYPLNTQKQGTLFKISIQNSEIHPAEKAINICRNFNIYLHRKPSLMNQNILSITMNNMIYHIPHVEWIRSLYTPNKILANALLRPNGLDFLVNSANITNDNVAFIDFVDEIPNSVMNKEFAHYLAWLYLTEDIKRSYASVQSNAYATSIINTYGMALEVTLPNITDMNLVCRGIKQGNEILVLEILGIDGVAIPFKKLHYSHKANKKYTYTDKARKKRISKKDQADEYILNENKGERSRVDANQPVIDLEPTQMAFRSSTEIVKVQKQEQKVNQGSEYISNEGRGGGIKQQVVGVDEAILGGKISPIEFKRLEIVDTFMNYGLDSFINMIQYLANKYSYLDISLNFVFLPLGRKFAYLPDGRRRICAIASVEFEGNRTYILEVAVPDNRTLSTLLLKSEETMESDERVIKNILKQLVYKSGNWDSNVLKKLRHRRTKHLGNISSQWAYRIKDNLSTLNNY
jgi:TnsE C-terminal domain